MACWNTKTEKSTVLNELHQVVKAMEKRRVPLVVPHSALEPMGKSRLLLVELDAHAVPQRLRVLPGVEAGKLLRVAHGSEGSSFPGFNLPLPLRAIPKTVELTGLGPLVDALRSKDASGGILAKAVMALFLYTTPAVFHEGPSGAIPPIRTGTCTMAESGFRRIRTRAGELSEIARCRRDGQT